MNKKYVYVIIGLVLVILSYLIFFKEKKIEKITDADIDNVSLYINGYDEEYYFIDNYFDKGVIATLNNKDISNLVTVTDNVNDKVIGEYEVTYRISADTKFVEKKKIIHITDINVEKSFDMTIKRVTLTINNKDYSYTIRPDGIKEESNTFSYTYNELGDYKFNIYLKSGSKKEYILNINNSDMEGPVGTCTSELKDNNTFDIKVEATDISGIKKYQYNNEDYINNTFSVSSSNSKIIIKVYDNNGNSSEIACKNVYGMGFKNIKPKDEKLGYAKCNTDVMAANIELEELMQSYGERSRSAVAAAALYLANYNYSIGYQWGGKYLKKGLNPEWGCSKFTMEHNDKLVCTHTTGADTCEAGLDCTGYTSWAFIQAGFDKSIIRTSSQSEGMWGEFNAIKHKYAFSKANLEIAKQIKPGDIVWREGHVGIVIGVNEDTVQIANEIGPIIVQTNKKSNGASTSGQAAFTHFVLFDDFYTMYGSNT